HINVDIKSGQELWLYSRELSESSRPRIIKILIGFEEQVIRQNYVNNQASYSQQIIYSLLFGILLLAGIFILFFFWLFREGLYFLGTLYFLFVFVPFISYSSLQNFVRFCRWNCTSSNLDIDSSHLSYIYF